MTRKFTQLKAIIILFILSMSFINQNAQTVAFPGAEGHGAYTTGGRGGTVYKVTNLNDSGEGSLRAAVEASGARTVIFEVSGTIYLSKKLQISNGYITIAGQTAPGDGITLANYALNINADNVIIRFIRCRMGDVMAAEDDAMNGRNQKNIIIDHCTMSWSTDEAASFYDNENFTMQWCLISESLYASVHDKGNHGYGGIWGGWGATFHHNLLAHHTSRNPRFCGARYHTDTPELEIVDFRNNVIYNWGFNSAYGGEYGNHNMVNNYYKYGPATNTNRRNRIINPSDNSSQAVISKWYIDGNYVYGYPSISSNNWNGGVEPSASDISLSTFRTDEPFATGPITTHDADVAYSVVMDYVGACFPVRDEIDTRIIGEVENGTATYGGAYGTAKGIIDTQGTVGGWPSLSSGTAPTDSDEDGMPDDWENNNSLNPYDKTDANTTNEEGYTMLEVYINSLVTEIMENGLAGGTSTDDSGDSGSGDNGEVTTVTIAKSTGVSSSGASSPWAFNGGYSVSNTVGKTYATGDGDGVKYSSGVQYTIILPDGVKVSSIKMTGYDNYSELDSYVSELNGSIYASTDYVFPAEETDGTHNYVSNTIDLETPASGTLTFTVSGKQVVLSIDLTIGLSTAIYTPLVEKKSPYDLINVYRIDGRIVRYQVVRQDALLNLPNGIYIVDGEKIGIYQ